MFKNSYQADCSVGFLLFLAFVFVGIYFCLCANEAKKSSLYEHTVTDLFKVFELLIMFTLAIAINYSDTSQQTTATGNAKIKLQTGVFSSVLLSIFDESVSFSYSLTVKVAFCCCCCCSFRDALLHTSAVFELPLPSCQSKAF